MPFYCKDAGFFVIIGDAPLNFALWLFFFLTFCKLYRQLLFHERKLVILTIASSTNETPA